MSADGKATINDLARADGDVETRLFLSSSFLSSVGQLALAGIAASFFIGWWSLLWFAVLTGLFALRSSGSAGRIPEGLFGTLSIAVGGAVFIAPAAAAWMVGGQSAGFLVATMCGTTAVVGTTLFASSRRNYWANMAPLLLLAAFVPPFAFNSFQDTLIVWLCMGATTLATMAARDNRNEVLQEVMRIQGEMEAARKESLAKSQFLATMSHELRTPLNAVIGYAEIMEEELKEDGRTDNATDAARISRSARSLLTLINEILDFSKIEAGRMELNIEPVEIDTLVNDVAQTVGHITKAHGTDVVIEIAPEARHVRTDAQRLRQCLLNLASNAAKFTESGSITINVGIEHDAGDTFLRVAVADTGCGIADDDAARLFQPFTQVDGSLTRRKDGTGLGLVITKRLAELMGGDVSFTSVLGQGSTFTLRVRDHASAQQALSGRGPVLLVIEDEASARDIARRMLAHLPLSFAEARTGAEGVSMARTHRPSLIVLDIHLPDCKGWSVLEDIKADDDLRETPVLVVSADDDRARAIRLGACDHLVKPVEKEQLAAAVLRFALAGAQALPAAQASADMAQAYDHIASLAMPQRM